MLESNFKGCTHKPGRKVIISTLHEGLNKEWWEVPYQSFKPLNCGLKHR